MANLTAYTTTSGLLVDPSAPNPLAPYTMSQLLTDALTILASYNYYAAADARAGYTYGIAPDGSFYVDMSAYRVNFLGSFGQYGSTTYKEYITYKPTGQYLDIDGAFNYSGLPFISAITSGNISKLTNNYQISGTNSYGQETVLGNFNYVGNLAFSGNISTYQYAETDTLTNKGFAYYYDGVASAYVNGLNPAATNVSNGVISDSGSILVHNMVTTDSFYGSGLSWGMNTKIGDLRLNTGNDVYTLTGTMGLTLNTGSGNDIVNVQSPNNIINGEDGTDNVFFVNGQSSYTIEFGGPSVYISDRISSADTNNTLLGVETVTFSNGSLDASWFSGARSLAMTDPAQFTLVSQMYLAYFNRAPDAVGLDFWANAKYNGYTDSQIASYFAATPESLAVFGTVSTQSSMQQINDFVNGVYENVLNRQPDAGGLQFWSNNIKNGSITPSDYILVVINSVNAQSDSASDKVYFSNKTDVGLHFGVANGLTNGAQSKLVMDTYNSNYSYSNPNSAVSIANGLADHYLNTVAADPQLVIKLVGVDL